MTRYTDEALDRAVAETFGRAPAEAPTMDAADRAVAEAFGRTVEVAEPTADDDAEDEAMRADLARALGTGDQRAADIFESIRAEVIREGLPRPFLRGRVYKRVSEANARRRRS